MQRSSGGVESIQLDRNGQVDKKHVVDGGGMRVKVKCLGQCFWVEDINEKMESF